MINISYRFDQDSSSLQISGMPDVSNGDSEDTIGILSSWSLKIIGSPQLEGEKEHLDDLMQVILKYSRSYISGIRKKIISNKKIVTLSPYGCNHKLLLNSTKKEVKPLEIILDDSELSDLTRCIDLLRFDPRFNIRWNINKESPFTKKYILTSISNYKNNSSFLYAISLFLFTSIILLFVPINNNIELIETNKTLDSYQNKGE
tara:strand:- start:4 stop:612 length:609 start_codon:yes stop_codon:yes gene_type:complete